MLQTHPYINSVKDIDVQWIRVEIIMESRCTFHFSFSSQFNEFTSYLR